MAVLKPAARQGLAAAQRSADYRVDLPGLHADCDANYLRLHKLLPQLGEREQWRYHMPHCRLLLQVVSRSRYTTEVRMHAEAETPAPGTGPAAAPPAGNWVAPPDITVRLYHDARMAEVVAVNGGQRLAEPGPGFCFPNRGLQQADERQQANRFLGEWLGHCLASARADFELIFDGRRR